MTAPTPNARSGGSNVTGSTTHAITLPTGIVAGEMLLVEVYFYAGTITSITATGWTVVASTFGTNRSMVVLSKVAAGSDTLSITTSVGCNDKHNSYRYPPGCTVSASTFATGAGTTPTPDPPAITPAGGSNDYAYHAFAGVDVTAATPTVTAAPSGYSNLTTR